MRLMSVFCSALAPARALFWSFEFRHAAYFDYDINLCVITFAGMCFSYDFRFRKFGGFGLVEEVEVFFWGFGRGEESCELAAVGDFSGGSCDCIGGVELVGGWEEIPRVGRWRQWLMINGLRNERRGVGE